LQPAGITDDAESDRQHQQAHLSKNYRPAIKTLASPQFYEAIFMPNGNDDGLTRKRHIGANMGGSIYTSSSPNLPSSIDSPRKRLIKYNIESTNYHQQVPVG